MDANSAPDRTQRNVAILKEANRLWHETKGGSVDYWMSICAENVRVWSIGGRAAAAPWAETTTVRDLLGAYYDALLGAWTMNHHRMDDYVAQGNRVVCIGEVSWTFKATGKVCTTPKLDVVTFDDVGRVVDFNEYFDTAAFGAACS